MKTDNIISLNGIALTGGCTPVPENWSGDRKDYSTAYWHGVKDATECINESLEETAEKFKDIDISVRKEWAKKILSMLGVDVINGIQR
jgi:hypothetical protein